MTLSERIERAVELLDWPSGSILGLHTLLMIGISAWLAVMKGKHPEGTFEMPTSVVDIYKFVLLNFSVVKGAKLGVSIWGKVVKDEPVAEQPK